MRLAVCKPTHSSRKPLDLFIRHGSSYRRVHGIHLLDGHHSGRRTHPAGDAQGRNRHGLADRGRGAGVLHAGWIRTAGERHEPRQERDQRDHEELLRHVLRRGRVLGGRLRPDVRRQPERLDRHRQVPASCRSRGRLRHAVLPDDVRRHSGHHRQRRDRRADQVLRLHRRLDHHHRPDLSGIRRLGLGFALQRRRVAEVDGLHRLRRIDGGALGRWLGGAGRGAGGRAETGSLRTRRKSPAGARATTSRRSRWAASSSGWAGSASTAAARRWPPSASARSC